MQLYWTKSYFTIIFRCFLIFHCISIFHKFYFHLTVSFFFIQKVNNNHDTCFAKPILRIFSIVSSCPVQRKQRRFSRFTHSFSDYIANCCIYLQNSEISKLFRGTFARILKESSWQPSLPWTFASGWTIKEDLPSGQEVLASEEEFRTIYRVQTE